MRIIEPGDTPQGQPAPPPPASPSAPAGPSPYDFSTDPILQRILAYDQQARQNAQAAADAARKQLAIQFGDASGIIDDAATAAAAGQNPFSVLANLKRNYDQLTKQHDQQLNNDNLFYSGTRVNQLQNDATGYQQRQYDARQQALAQLGNIQNQLTQALSGADQADINATSDAYGRAQQQALTYGYDPGATTSTTSGSAASTGYQTPPPTVAHQLVRPVSVTANPTGASARRTPSGRYSIFSIH